ncbi:MAG: GIY-YIG nuclease family protein [Patescibacteria group bacterium]|nr:GIY-YIG nuclease family protein [Patescibacteria group bacterium]
MPIFLKMFTYLIKSLKDGSYYTGITNNIERRLQEHNRGILNVTKSKRPWELVYWKKHPAYSEARKHERWFKKKNRDYKNKLGRKLAG